MAERPVAAAVPVLSYPPTGPVRSYALLAWTWLRAAAQYPLSMVLLSLATAVVTALDVAGIGLLFAHAPRIAGFTAPEVLFLYGTSGLSFVILR